MSKSYALGFDDGYAEGYACKLADATTTFNPSSADLPDRIEEAANHLQRKYAKVFDGDRAAAIGLARQMAKILAGEQATPKGDRNDEG